MQALHGWVLLHAAYGGASALSGWYTQGPVSRRHDGRLAVRELSRGHILLRGICVAIAMPTGNIQPVCQLDDLQRLLCWQVPRH